ncbi:hypothetical protein BCY86_07020 [Pajaroellobacter abortibovis]|uniref:mannose-1-phosphate guanylyltransferase n=1 Tax=Pajaroellobacter abortibovis TaxID=1882918 RepID=A0A1L6MZE7_9BACT|nr:hypothetical protein BCY86_07020 [Pajaroellobacter abortibovis]
MQDTYAVILAGGAGTRFWPASRKHIPKQLLPLAGLPNESMVAATVRRLSPLIPSHRMLISTSQHLLPQVKRVLPTTFVDAQFLSEPVGRNTAPCIGWATFKIVRQNENARIVVLPSDHFIADEQKFLQTIERALDVASKGYLTTIGIIPTRPETGYGYIELGDPIDPHAFQCKKFTEKPSYNIAQKYVASQKHLWNAGIFCFQAKVMKAAISNSIPSLADGLVEIEQAALQGEEEESIHQVFPRLPSLSIDYGIMEKASNLAVVPADFGWNDVGSWASAWELAVRDEHGNVLPSNAIALCASNNFYYASSTNPSKKLVALVDVHDFVIVDTEDTLLIVPRERSQEVRSVVEQLQQRKQFEWL